MSQVRAKGRRVGGYSTNAYTTYDYRSPGITLPCEKYLNKPEELAKLSGAVITYKEGEEPK